MSYPNIAKTMLCKELLSGVWWQRCFCYIISILFRGFESFKGSEEGRVACTSTTATDQGFLFPFSVLIFIHILTAWTDNLTTHAVTKPTGPVKISSVEGRGSLHPCGQKGSTSEPVRREMRSSPGQGEASQGHTKYTWLEQLWEAEEHCG